MGNKKYAVIGGSAVLLVAVVASVAVVVTHRSGGGSSNAKSEPHMTTSVKAIKEFCRPTDYQQTSPTELAKAIFKVTTERVQQAFNHSETLAELAHDKRTSGALQNCRELLEYAVEDLKTSFDQLGGFEMSNFQRAVDDLKTWLSAVLTYQDTCLDGFENTTTDAAQSMSKALKSASELTANILAIVDEFSNTIGSMNIPFMSRRLLEADGEGEAAVPEWVSAGKRRLLQAGPLQLKPNVTVAQDGSGDFKTITEALATVPKKSEEAFVIYVKEGVYSEYVTVDRDLTNVVMYGDGPTKTRVTGNRNFRQNITTKDTATFTVVGNGFFARDLGFENSAGAENHQAVALRVQSDLSVFYQCQFDGYQDTLYTHAYRQFYRDCTVTGTIDFIFGNAQVVLQNCLILVRRPLDNQQNIVTAQGRKEKRSAGGIILHNCTVTADPSFEPVKARIPTYLGRPWKEYSRTFYIQCQLDDLINPVGWLPWLGDYGLRTCFYTEVDNRGPGSDTSARATWKGVKKVSYEHAQKFTVEHFLQGHRWIPRTGVPYIPGLLPQSQPTRTH
ncbi:probable pectinesterase/pectinesterase inhibitor 21 [Ananas comosus]|uniref:Pectinesterase n=1 Tax=Ananas comosus TaxID=4615 RepID=A0A6P5GRF5_ANACO|nr:probable pectinesterase/pectinesterase inhibitor 21 [Ananas comosus]